MILELDLAFRFLRRRVGLLLRGTALAAFFGIALATMALVVTLALMRGYSGAIASALQQGNAHLVGFSPRRMAASESIDLARRMATVAGVRRSTPVTYLAALAEDPADTARPLPVVLKAVAEPPEYSGLRTWPDRPTGAGSDRRRTRSRARPRAPVESCPAASSAPGILGVADDQPGGRGHLHTGVFGV